MMMMGEEERDLEVGRKLDNFVRSSVRTEQGNLTMNRQNIDNETARREENQLRPYFFY